MDETSTVTVVLAVTFPEFWFLNSCKFVAFDGVSSMMTLNGVKP